MVVYSQFEGLKGVLLYYTIRGKGAVVEAGRFRAQAVSAPINRLRRTLYGVITVHMNTRGRTCAYGQKRSGFYVRVRTFE